MRPQTQRIARFGLLTALALILGLMDRAIPVSALLGGFVPGIKLGLANTVLLYAVYLMDVKSSILLMLTKVLLSGFIFGSMSAILYSLAGGVLSLIVMLLLQLFSGKNALDLFPVCFAFIFRTIDVVYSLLHIGKYISTTRAKVRPSIQKASFLQLL